MESSGFGGSQAVKQSVALHEGHALQLQRCATTSAKRPEHTEQNQAMKWPRICLPSFFGDTQDKMEILLTVLPTYAPVNRNLSAGGR